MLAEDAWRGRLCSAARRGSHSHLRRFRHRNQTRPWAHRGLDAGGATGKDRCDRSTHLALGYFAWICLKCKYGSKQLRSVFTFKANPCEVTEREMCTPIAAIFPGGSACVQAPVSPGTRLVAMPKSPQVRMRTSSSRRT